MATTFGSTSPFDMTRRIGAELSALVREELGVQVGDPLVRPSPPAQEGDFQSTLALRLGQARGADPGPIARMLAGGLSTSSLYTPPTVTGRGFLNFHLRRELVEAAVASIARDPRLGVASAAAPRRVVIDYSAPNVAKEMHVGNLRSTIIGDCLRKILVHFGHEVIPQNHIGDWGTPFGMLVEHMLDLDVDFGVGVGVGVGEAGPGCELEDLNLFYQAARAKFDADEPFADRSRRRVVLLQRGDEESLAQWRRLRDASAAYFQRIYALLDVELTPQDIVGESFYNPQLAGVVAELQSDGLLTESDGALCLFLPGYRTREGEPMPMIVRKRGGGFNYATTDLAALRHRLRDLGASSVLYVVGAPQALHFRMLFDAAALAGWATPADDLRHVAFGLVLGEDRKPFRTRSGDSVKLGELLDEAVARAAVMLEDRQLDGAADEGLARIVGIGAVKYADLAGDRVRDYQFSFDRMLSFEGDTAAYLQYAHARVRSLLRRHGEGWDPAAPIVLAAPEERALALGLMRFGTDLAAAADALQPHRLCLSLHDLAARFSTFYEACPVGDADPPVRSSRLTLSDLTGRTLATGLGLLGIRAPERL